MSTATATRKPARTAPRAQPKPRTGHQMMAELLQRLEPLGEQLHDSSTAFAATVSFHTLKEIEEYMTWPVLDTAIYMKFFSINALVRAVRDLHDCNPEVRAEMDRSIIPLLDELEQIDAAEDPTGDAVGAPPIQHEAADIQMVLTLATIVNDQLTGYHAIATAIQDRAAQGGDVQIVNLAKVLVASITNSDQDAQLIDALTKMAGGTE